MESVNKCSRHQYEVDFRQESQSNSPSASKSQEEQGRSEKESFPMAKTIYAQRICPKVSYTFGCFVKIVCTSNEINENSYLNF